VSAVEVVVVDSGVANLGSVMAALARLDAPARLTTDPAVLRAARRVILPGVGAAAPAMMRLRERGLDRVIPTLTCPVLGICLGMQLLFEHTEEGGVDCLGVVPGRLRRFEASRCGRVPHMGWNQLQALRESPLIHGFGPDPYAYFVHSYYAPVAGHTLSACDYGGPFAAVVQHRNFFGAQFHPERSAAVGATLIRNFVSP
jgi:imidazole glycerol-phosphate synthase subunit HisH